jgi:hypothetical protein
LAREVGDEGADRERSTTVVTGIASDERGPLGSKGAGTTNSFEHFLQRALLPAIDQGRLYSFPQVGHENVNCISAPLGSRTAHP